MNKIRTTLYIDRDILNLAHMEKINISQTVEQLLSTHMSLSTVDQINTKIAESEAVLRVLKEKRKALQRKTNKSIVPGPDHKALGELKELFKKRRETIGYKGDDKVWITSPKNLARCKTLGSDPQDVLDKLIRWYDTTNE